MHPTTHAALRLTLALSACLPLFNGFSSAAAESSGASASATTPTTGRPIAINVEVTDKQGHHVRGLKPSDFSILDNNQPVRLAAFQPVTDAGSAGQISVVLVVDMINSDWDTVSREREQVMEFLTQNGGHLQHPTTVAMLTDDGLKVERLTSLNGNTLQADLNSTNSVFRLIGRSTGYYGNVTRMVMSLGQISQLAAYEAPKPGRKLFFVISPGWPLLDWVGMQEDMNERRWTFESIEQLSNGLRDADITLYALQPYELGRSDDLSRSNPFYYRVYLKPALNAGQAIYPDLSLQVLSEQSGGRVLVTGHSITEEINDVERDANSYYILSYPRPAASHPDDYHAIQVKLDRPDLQVHTTAGYYLRTSPATAPKPKDKGKPGSKNGKTH